MQLDAHVLGYVASQRMKRAMVEVHHHPERLTAIDNALWLAKTLSDLPFDFSLWQSQNLWYDTLERARREPLSLSEDERAHWMEKFNALGSQLHMSVDDLVVEDDGAEQLSETL